MSNTVVTDALPVKSKIHDTPYEELLNNTIGYLLEETEEEITNIVDGFNMQTATAKYLDLIGKDYNIQRRTDETDENYRKRLLIEPSDHFSEKLLYDVYDVQLLTYKNGLRSGRDYTLLSDNTLLSDRYIVDVDDTVWEIINKKFIVQDTLIRWSEWS